MKQKLIKDAKGIFQYIDSDFENWGVDEGMHDLGKLQLTSKKLEKDSTFKEMFKAEDSIAQSDVIKWVEENKDELSDTEYYSFLLKNSSGEFFVAGVLVRSGGLFVFVDRFEYDSVWYAGRLHRMVVPQLDSQDLNPSALSPSDSLTLPKELVINGITYIQK